MKYFVIVFRDNFSRMYEFNTLESAMKVVDNCKLNNFDYALIKGEMMYV